MPCDKNCGVAWGRGLLSSTRTCISRCWARSFIGVVVQMPWSNFMDSQLLSDLDPPPQRRKWVTPVLTAEAPVLKSTLKTHGNPLEAHETVPANSVVAAQS